MKPTDIYGTLPQNANDALEVMIAEMRKQNRTKRREPFQIPVHHISVARLGAVTIDTANLWSLKNMTVEQVQAASECAALVVFFKAFDLDQSKTKPAKQFNEIIPLARYFGEGVIAQLHRAVLMMGNYTNPTGTEIRWFPMPEDPKAWFPGMTVEKLSSKG